MKTISCNVDDRVLLRLEEQAAAQETSVGDVVSDLLQQWVNANPISNARQEMTRRFAQPNWQFAVGAADTREERNARP